MNLHQQHQHRQAQRQFHRRRSTGRTIILIPAGNPIGRLPKRTTVLLGCYPKAMNELGGLSVEMSFSYTHKLS